MSAYCFYCFFCLVCLNECILFLLLFLSCDSPGSREVRGEGEEPRALCKI